VVVAEEDFSKEKQMVTTLLKESPLFRNKKEFPQLMNLEELTQVHETVRHLFAHLRIQEMPLAGRLRHFLPAWEFLTQDKQMLSIVRGFEIPFYRQFCRQGYNIGFLQNVQIQALRRSSSFQQKVSLTPLALEELSWRVENLTLQNGRSMIPAHNQIVLQTDASKKGWGAFCQGIRTGGAWSSQEKNFHINILELLAIKYAILSIFQER